MRYSLEEFEEYDKKKSKVLKYVIFKKRTEQEVRKKFENEYEEDILEEIIEDLKENSYIDDYQYIERTMQEFYNLKNLSIKEVQYKLYAKGIDKSLIEDYISNNKDELEEYEKNSAKKIIEKKKYTMEENNIKIYLLKKGYKQETIKEVMQD